METIDNNFFNSTSKNLIIGLIDNSRGNLLPSLTPAPSARDKARERRSGLVAIIAALLGGIGSPLPIFWSSKTHPTNHTVIGSRDAHLILFRR